MYMYWASNGTGGQRHHDYNGGGGDYDHHLDHDEASPCVGDQGGKG